MLGNLTSCMFSLAFIPSLFNQQKLYKSNKKLTLHLLVQLLIFSSVKETNRFINKEMCVLLFNFFNGCSLVLYYLVIAYFD